jgi:hypothetical protein
MRTTSFKQLRNSVLRKMGLDADQLVLPSQAAALADYIQHGLSDVWGLYDWPDTTLTEPRTPVATSFPLRAPALTTIGTILRITDREPSPTRLVQTYSFIFDDTTATITDPRYTAGTEVRVKFRLPEPRLAATPYSPSTAYAPGDVVYLDSTGDCYLCIAPTTGNAPTDASFWERQAIPAAFAPYLRSATHALTLEEDGQYDKAAFQLQKAEAEIVKTHDDIFLRENNTPLTWSLQRDTTTPY